MGRVKKKKRFQFGIFYYILSIFYLDALTFRDNISSVFKILHFHINKVLNISNGAFRRASFFTVKINF